MNKISNLQIGESVYFLEDGLKPFEIKAKKDKFIIAVEEDTAENYTIIDTDKEMCGPHDRTFNPYYFNEQDSINECLEDMINRKNGIKLSGRHSAKIKDVLDLERTLSKETNQ